MSIKPKPIMKNTLAYFEDRGADLKTYSLLLAVYYDEFEKAHRDNLTSKTPMQA